MTQRKKYMPLCQLINLLFRFFFLFLFLNDKGLCLWVAQAGHELLASDVFPSSALKSNCRCPHAASFPFPQTESCFKGSTGETVPIILAPQQRETKRSGCH